MKKDIWSVRTEEQLGFVNFLCVLQFIVFFIVTKFLIFLDAKVILGFSAICGLLLSGAARRSYIHYQVEQSSKPLGAEILKSDSKDKKKSGK